MKYAFLYRDQLVSQSVVGRYSVGDVLHENGQVAASHLRGGMLTNTNVRYLFITKIGSNFLLVNEDYRGQELFLFEASMYYVVYDVYRIGEYTQILVSPDSHLENWGIDDIVDAARRDFNDLLNVPPVGVLDTPEWRRRLLHPLGKYGKNPPHKRA